MNRGHPSPTPACPKHLGRHLVAQCRLSEHSESRGVRWVKEKHAGVVSAAGGVSVSGGQTDESGQQPMIPNHNDCTSSPPTPRPPCPYPLFFLSYTDPSWVSGAEFVRPELQDSLLEGPCTVCPLFLVVNNARLIFWIVSLAFNS